MNNPQILFVKQFLALLLEKDVRTIPINNDRFQCGIQNMSDYFRENRNHLGPFTDNLELLFLKYSTRGDYQQFAKIIEGFNGRVVSLENPHYVKANIKLEDDYAEELISNNELEIPVEEFRSMVECFRMGADI